MSSIIRRAPLVLGLLLGAFGLALAWAVEDYTLGQLSGMFYLTVVVVSLNLLTGVGGQLSMGHAAFFGVGAYAVALLVNRGWDYWSAGAVGVVLSAAVGVAVSLPALRIRGLYIVLTSLGVALVFPTLIQATREHTGGTAGLLVDEQFAGPESLGLTPQQWTYLVLLVLTAGALILVHNIRHSRVGRALMAMRDNEVVAESFGVPVRVAKVVVFGVSAGLAGLAGAMFTMQSAFVSPADFGLSRAIDFFVGMAVAGPTSVFGALVGGAFLQYVPQLASSLGLNNTLIDAVYGAILLALIYFFRRGAGGLAEGLMTRVVASGRRPEGRRTASPDGVPARQTTRRENDVEENS